MRPVRVRWCGACERTFLPTRASYPTKCEWPACRSRASRPMGSRCEPYCCQNTFFMAFGTLALTVIWTPLLLRDNGISPARASIVLGVHRRGALIGMAVAGRLMERLGVAATLVPSLVLGAIVTATLSYAATSVATMSTALLAGRSVRRPRRIRLDCAGRTDLSRGDPFLRGRLGHGHGTVRPGACAAVRRNRAGAGLERCRSFHGNRTCTPHRRGGTARASLEWTDVAYR